MDESERSKWAKALIAKIHVITGWTIPEDELLTILIDQFIKKIMEGYRNVNPDEFEFAFRSNGGGVKDWGKNMNLSLIDEVMAPYLSTRYDLSLQEEQHAKLFPQIENKEDMSQEAMIDWYNATAKKIKAGELTVDFVPLMLYEFMDANGNITATKEQKYMYIQRAADYRQGQLERDVEKNDCHATQWRLSSFLSQKNRGYFEGDEMDVVKSLAKKILLFELIINS